MRSKAERLDEELRDGTPSPMPTSMDYWVMGDN